MLDPFANQNSIKKEFINTNCNYISNDLDTEMPTDYHMEAQDFFKTISRQFC